MDLPGVVAAVEAHPAYDRDSTTVGGLLRKLAAAGLLSHVDPQTGQTLFHTSAARGKPYLTRHLLALCPNAADAQGRYPLHHALSANVTSPEHFAAWQGVLKDLATPEALAARTCLGDTALHSAIRSGKTGRVCCEGGCRAAQMPR